MSVQNIHNGVTGRLMSMFAKQASNNVVTGIDAGGFVQRLLLFDHCIIASVWLKDVQRLLRLVDPTALCKLIDADAISFYIDSATAAESGQARSKLHLTGNTTSLRDNEFSFSSIRGHNQPEMIRKAIDQLANTEGVPTAQAKQVAERIEGVMLEPKGLELLSDSFKAFYAEIRSTNSTTIKDIVGKKLQKLGQKPSGLNLTIEEFVPEDFRVSSNLISRFGLSPLAARNICLQSLLDLVSVYARLAHMREFSCLMGVEEKEQIAWEMKVDSLVQTVTHEGANRQEQFIRVANIAGLGENQLLHGGSIDLDRLIELRQTDELILFKAWLRESGNKSEQEIRERVTSLRSKIGNKLVGTGGKMLRLMFTSLPSFIPDPVLSLSASLAFSSMDSFLFERIAPKDAVLGVLVKEYPAIFRK